MTSDKSGFTLLEVLIALAIMAGVITTVVVTFNRHMDIATEESEKTRALLLARTKLEEPGFLTQTNAEGDFSPDFPSMKWKRLQTDSDFPGLKRFTLTVSWEPGNRSLTLVTYAR